MRARSQRAKNGQTREKHAAVATDPIITEAHEFMNNDHEFISVDHDRITVAHELMTAHHDALPTSLAIIINAHDWITNVTYFDTDDHEFMSVAHEFVMIGSVREHFDSSRMATVVAAYHSF